MLFRNRLAVVFTALPLAFYAYACSDDPSAPATDAGTDGGTNDVDSGPNETSDSGDADGGDGGDSGPVLTCVGNPLADDDGGTDGGVLLDVTALRAIAAGPFLDGPQWIDDDAGGAIVYSEVNNQAIVRNGPDGGARVVLRETGANNLPIGNARSGDFIYTALARSAPATGGAILRMLADGGEPTALDAGAAANSPNDIVASSKGYLYFTDPGFQTSDISTGVFRLGPDGAVTTVQLFAGGQTMRADGIALTKDETTLYVSFFDVKQISKYTVDAEGVASNPQAVAFQPIDHPTALAVDLGGNLWIAENTEGAISGRIEVIDPTGKKWGEIPFADSRPTGIAFGGPDSKTVYVTTERDTEAGTLWVLTSRCPGVR
jgi:gluconolactonase